MNYFEWFNLEPNFRIDTQLLRKRFLQKSLAFHPDKYIGADAIEMTSLNNAAYETLKERDLRIGYLIELYSEDKEVPSLDPVFLMEMMELNERVDDLAAEASEVCVKEISDLLERHMASVEREISSYVSKHSDGLGNHFKEDLVKVQKNMLKKKYLLRISEKINTFARTKN